LIKIVKKMIRNLYIDIKEKNNWLSRNNKVNYLKRMTRNVLPYSYYAYCLYHASDLAVRLGIHHFSVIEFGVAGGNGLLALEKHTEIIERIFNVHIEIYGFDSGEGMFSPRDYRDMPYFFTKGNYQMNKPKLMPKLKRAKLIIGNVTETAPAFIETYRSAPIAAAMFDLDYYSSTTDALALFCSDNEQFFLPRLFTYFDNTVGNEIKLYNEFTGELLAISDFNAAQKNIKIAKSQQFHAYRRNHCWHHKIFIMHRFLNPYYNKYIASHKPESLSLKE